ncbi:MAG: DUF2235 domain-containing protein [Sneathiellales bacterium]|nr:DUF2235 domain-containing protein [Sneathiellales bacterium]
MMRDHRPRKIVLLSDGTCNSSVKAQKTNIWRLYNAIPPLPDKNGNNTQIAFYDDGVGTMGFRPLMLLGAVFGWGLSRNVKQLYEDLCRHYRPGDKVYIFGFSRGAFTARVLVDMINRVGIIDTSKSVSGWSRRDLHREDLHDGVSLKTEKEFKRAVHTAYKSYRNGKWRGRLIPRIYSSLFRAGRELLLRSHVPSQKDFKDRFCYPDRHDPEPIEFVGCFDTVDALGLPIDELAYVWDQLVFPYKFNDEQLSGIVKKAAHAIAVDDERHTFHPVLWDHSRDNKDRITQVWFSGMHANVGGGYPEDHLSYVPLCWMMDQIDRQTVGPQGLVFDAAQKSYFQKCQNYNGLIHNSRRGAGVLYRFKPRNIARNWNAVATDPANSKDVNIHHSVLDRIMDRNAGYSPAGIPDNFRIADEKGCYVPQSGNKYYLSPDANKARGSFLSWAEDFIAWGRAAYFVMISSFLYVLLMPFIHLKLPALKVDAGMYQSYAEYPINLLESFIKSVGIDFTVWGIHIAGAWTESWKLATGNFYGAVLVFVLSYLAGVYFKKRCFTLSDEGWAEYKVMPRTLAKAEKGWFARVANWFRTNPSSQFLSQAIVHVLFPVVFFSGLVAVGIFIIDHGREGLLAQKDKIICTSASPLNVNVPVEDTKYPDGKGYLAVYEGNSQKIIGYIEAKDLSLSKLCPDR